MLFALAGEAVPLSAFRLRWRGLIAGVAISAPVGPLNVLRVSRTITGGCWAEIALGLAGAAADTVYGSIACLSISFIVSFLIQQQSELRSLGGILPIALGDWYYLKRSERVSRQSDFFTTFFLNLTKYDDGTFISGRARGARPAGAAASLADADSGRRHLRRFDGLVGRVDERREPVRNKFNESTMLWMNRIGGVWPSAYFGI
jgi:hypothetical protein